jgi:plastocyanin
VKLPGRRKLGAALALGLLAAALTTSCRGGSTIHLADGTRATDRGEADVSGTASAVVELGEYYFEPTVLRGAPGQRLTLTLSNQGSELHNFRIPGRHVDTDVEAATPVTVTVTFPQSGAVTFECRYHLSQSMRGELAVTPPPR